MTSHCNECKKKAQGPFTPKVIEILNEAQPVLFYRVDYPAELGDDTTLNVEELNYKNVLLYFESNKHAYLYSSDGIPTRISVEPIDIDYILEELERLGVEVKSLDEKVDQHYREFEELNEFTHLEVDNLRDITGNLQRDLEQEVADRKEADEAIKSETDSKLAALDDKITNEFGEKLTELENKVSGEIGTDITNLQNDLQAEATARKEADDNLQSQIDAIESKSDVVDIVDTYADLESYNTSALGDNDVVKVLSDETHDDAISYYRWDKTAGTWNYVGSIGPYYTKAETDEKITEAMGGVEIPERAKNLPKNIVGYALAANQLISGWDLNETSATPQLRTINLDTGSASNSAQLAGVLRAASSTQAGLMSAADKTNLDALVEGGGGGSSVELLGEYKSSPTTSQAYDATYINNKLNSQSVSIGGSSQAAANSGTAVGTFSSASASYSTAVGGLAQAGAGGSCAFGENTKCSNANSVALGSFANTTRDSEVSIGSTTSTNNDFKTRYLANVRDGVLPQDACTVNQLNTAVGNVEAILARLSDGAGV